MSTPSKTSPSASKTASTPSKSSPLASKSFNTPTGKSGSPKTSSSTKASPSGPSVSVVLIRQIPDPEVKDKNPPVVKNSFTAFSMPKAQFDGLKWDDSPASIILGFPVKGTRWQGEQGKVRNPLATGLYVEPDPNNLDDFGKVEYRKIAGQFVVARQDEGPLTIEDVQALTLYLVKVSEELIAFTREVFLDGNEKQRRANDLAGRLFTPASFEAYKATKAWSA